MNISTIHRQTVQHSLCCFLFVQNGKSGPCLLPRHSKARQDKRSTSRVIVPSFRASVNISANPLTVSACHHSPACGSSCHDSPDCAVKCTNKRSMLFENVLQQQSPKHGSNMFSLNSKVHWAQNLRTKKDKMLVHQTQQQQHSNQHCCGAMSFHKLWATTDSDNFPFTLVSGNCFARALLQHTLKCPHCGLCWFQVFSSVWLGDLRKPHSKELSIGKAVAVFRFHKSMTREARRGERRLSRGSLHWHQVLLEPGHSFMSPES